MGDEADPTWEQLRGDVERALKEARAPSLNLFGSEEAVDVERVLGALLTIVHKGGQRVVMPHVFSALTQLRLGMADQVRQSLAEVAEKTDERDVDGVALLALLRAESFAGGVDASVDGELGRIAGTMPQLPGGDDERAAKRARKSGDAAYEEGLQAWDSATKVAGDRASTWNSLAVHHLSHGRAAEAKKVLEALVAREPEYTDALCNLAIAKRILNEDDSHALLGDGEHPEAMVADAVHLLSTLSGSVAQVKQAILLLVRCLAIDAGNVAAWSNLAMAYRRLERRYEAILCAQRAFVLTQRKTLGLYTVPRSVRGMAAFTLCLLHVIPDPRFVEGDSALARAVDDTADAAVVDAADGSDETMLAMERLAHSWTGTLLTPLSDSSLGVVEAGPGPVAARLLAASNKRGVALATISAALELDSGSAWTWTQLGLVEMQNEAYAAAARYFQRALSFDVHNPSAVHNLAMARHLSGDADFTKEPFSGTSDVSTPAAVAGLLASGMFCRMRGNFRGAMELFNAVLHSTPDDAIALNERALVHVATDNLTAAREDLLHLLSVHPGHRVAKANLERLKGLEENA